MFFLTRIFSRSRERRGERSIIGSFRSSVTASQRNVSSWLKKTERNFPRLFSIVFVFLLPFTALLCWALFCGHFLALIESEGELQANNEILSTDIKYRTKMFEIRRNEAAMEKERNMGCLDEFMNSTLPSEMINGTELRSFMKYCSASADDEVKFSPYDPHNDPVSFYDIGDLQFNWNKCSEKEVDQWSAFIGKWYESFAVLFEQYTVQEGLNEEEASIRAAEEAKGNDACKVNTGGGGIFWFTIMTTIGYGNAAPVTTLGRWFVMILGLPSIIMFTAALGAIGYVSLTIADDLLRRLDMSKLTKGWIAAIFWLCIFILSMLTLAGMAHLFIHLTGWKEFAESANIPSFTFIESFWFAFATMTTVGLGDIHIPHHIFAVHYMFTIPLFILAGFVSLANFILKLSDAISGAMDNKDTLSGNKSLRSILSEGDDAGAYDNVDMCFPNRRAIEKDHSREDFLPVRSIEKKGDRKVVTFDPKSYGDENIPQDSPCSSPALRKKEADHDPNEDEISDIDQYDEEGDHDMKEKMQEQDCFPLKVPS